MRTVIATDPNGDDWQKMVSEYRANYRANMRAISSVLRRAGSFRKRKG